MWPSNIAWSNYILITAHSLMSNKVEVVTVTIAGGGAKHKLLSKSFPAPVARPLKVLSGLINFGHKLVTL